MNKVLSDLLTGLQLADPQLYQHIVVFPLCSAINHSPDYLTLPEALEQRLLEIKEIGQQGSVPELKVVNRAEQPVLLLDGEEQQFKSTGCGDDYRCKGKGLVGSALIHQGQVIHTAFFRVEKADETGNMSTLNRRRDYRV